MRTFSFFIIMHPYTLYSHFYFSFLKVAHHTRYIALTLTIPVFFLQRWTKFITNHFKEIRELQKSFFVLIPSFAKPSFCIHL
jgi:hypothetical protein